MIARSPGPSTFLSPETSLALIPDVPTQSPCHDKSEGVDAATQLAIHSPLPPGKTLIVYHPHSKLPPKIVDTNPPEHVVLSCPQPDGPSNIGDDPPFSPFRTLGDFEQTEFFVANNYSDRQINEQLQLLANHTKPRHQGGGITLSNSREMHKLLHQACENFDQPEVGGHDHRRVHS